MVLSSGCVRPDVAFLEAIAEQPEDDLPRLVYADWLEEYGDEAERARAEFIRLQCRRARLSLEDPELESLLGQEVVLLRAHWNAWTEPLRELVGPGASRQGGIWLWRNPDTLTPAEWRSVLRVNFRRGFVERLAFTGERFLECAGQIPARTPLLQLDLWNADPVADRLARCRQLEWLTELWFRDPHSGPVSEAGMRALAASPWLGRLRSLFLGQNNLGDDGAEALAEAPWLAGLHCLNLEGNGLSPFGVAALAQSSLPRRLETLSLEDNLVWHEGVRALLDSPWLEQVRWLNLNRCVIGDEGVALLARAERLSRLERLSLDGNNLTERAVRELASSPWLGGLQWIRLGRIPDLSPDRVREILRGSWTLSSTLQIIS
jgi:uncharacterized protein (TIGR02996 family)